MIVKRSGKMFVVVLVTALLSSVGFGAALDSGGVIGLIHDEVSFIDTDIDVLHRGDVEDAKPANVLPVIKATVAHSTIDAAAEDNDSPHTGTSVFMVDISETLLSAIIPLTGPTDLRHAENSGQTLASKINRFAQLLPASLFDFKIALGG